MSSALTILKPLTVTSAMLTSNVSETDYSAWNSATAYTAGDRVIRTSTHKVYERLISGTTATAPESDTTNWLEISYTNRWKMFDSYTNTQTVKAGSIAVSIQPGEVINSVAMLNVSATSVNITMTDPVDGVVYDKDVPMGKPPTESDYWEYFFEPIDLRTQAVAIDLPAYGSATIDITITSSTGDAKCGVCLIGTRRDYGIGVKSGATIGIQDYSRKDTDQFGNYTIVQRNWAKRASFNVAVQSWQVDSLYTTLADLRTTPTLWIASGRYEGMVIYGYYKDFGVSVDYYDYSNVSLEIEGLI